jgi:hypothetical protein
MRLFPFIRLRLARALHLNITFDHFRKPLEGCYHGTDSWPWWKCVGVSICRAQNSGNAVGWHVWIYTPFRHATNQERAYGKWAQRTWLNRGRCIGIYLDHRTPEQLGYR